MRFLPPQEWERCEFLLRVDADVSFDSTVVKSLLSEFANDPTLGIGGPALFEPSRGGWHEMRVPRFQANGPMKVYSRACFKAIGGLNPGEGWDTIDLVSAMMNGFKTACFRHIHARHHRPMGKARGAWVTQCRRDAPHISRGIHGFLC